MAKLYYTTESGKFLIKEAMLNKESVEGFRELFGDDELGEIVLEKAGEYPWIGKYSVCE